MFETHFTALDAIIVVAYLAGTVLLGIYVNRHIHNSAGYLVGGRAAGTALSVATLIGTELGLITLMYAAQAGFTKGFSYLILPLIWGIVTLLIGATGLGVAPLRRMQLTTITEFFERRYSRNVRLVAGMICLLAGVLNMSLFPRMGAEFITFVSGYGGEDVDLLVKLITTVLVVLVLLYTMLGGMVAVIVTDYIQFVVLSLGLGLGLLYCFNTPDLSWEIVTQSWYAKHGEAAFCPTKPGPYRPEFIAWQTLLAIGATICWAPNATRSLTTTDEKTTRRAYFFSSAGLFARFAIPGLWGLIAFAYFRSTAVPEELTNYFGLNHTGLSDDVQAKFDALGTQAMPLLLGKLLPTGFLGILVAGLLAAFMSTHDSYLLSWSTVGSQDVIGPLKRRELSSDESIRYTRMFVLAIGVLLILFGIWFEPPQDLWKYLSLTGTIYVSGAATALLGGIYWRRASTTGALLALFGGLTALLALAAQPIQTFVANRLGSDIENVKQWLNDDTILLGVYALCVSLFVAGSLLFPDRPSGTPSIGKDD